jgi:hydroxyacylglutathione hydrolase
MSVLTAFADNYVYLYRYDVTRAVVIDPGDHAVVLKALNERSIDLTAVLVTHHHSDHTAGIPELKQATGCQVIGSDPRIRGIDQVVKDGDRLEFGDTTIEVLASPGHTRLSVCYHRLPGPDDPGSIVWTGDTLFAGGCGRLFECDAATLWRTLQRLATLAGQTQVCGGHNYAIENYRFGLTIEPGNQAIQDALDQALRSERTGDTVASTMDRERQTNVFLRADLPEVRSALAMTQAPVHEVFAELRRRKDRF